MGITGLLPFLKCASRPVNIQEFAGCTVAIDAYCWLHKGAFGCAEKLARGESTDAYVSYCMKFINMLLSNNIRPILVFDGRHLPAKAETEKGRRETREANRRKAAELLRMDRGDEARTYLQRCIDITPEMASALIKKCHATGIDCIVAPFEADAQLAYLSINNIAHIIITEDSDLMLFGCKKVIFKMNSGGFGVLIDQEKLPLALKVRPEQFSMDKFRHMCILAGCDYLSSLPGVGLQKACKFIKRTAELDMRKALKRLGAHLNMSLIVTPDYVEKFLIADKMFKHQPVFDPRTRKVVPLTPLPEGEEPPLVCTLSPEVSYQIAIGNVNPFNFEKIDDWDPDNPTPVKTTSWNAPVNKNSIWSSNYSTPKPLPAPKDPRSVARKSTQGNVVVKQVNNLVDKMASLPQQKKPEDEVNELRAFYEICSQGGATDSGFSSEDIADTQLEERKAGQNNLDITIVEDSTDETAFNSQIMVTVDEIFDVNSQAVDEKRKRNPFARNQTPSGSSATPNTSGLSKMAKINKTVIDYSVIVQSRFFNNDCDTSISAEPKTESENENNITSDDLGSLLNHIETEGQKSKDEEDSNPIPPTPSPVKNMETTVTPSSQPRNLFASPPKAKPSQTELFKNFSVKQTERPSFLSVIDSVSKFISEQEESKPNPKPSSLKLSSDVKKQSTIGGFIASASKNEASSSEESSSQKENSIEKIASVKSPPSKSPKTATYKKSIKPKTPLQPARSVGLKRKKSAADPDQPSIFDMFAFRPKSKFKTEV